MGQRTSENFHTRTLQKTGGESYVVTLPVDIIRQLGWQKGQKVEVEQREDGILIRDWEG